MISPVIVELIIGDLWIFEEVRGVFQELSWRSVSDFGHDWDDTLMATLMVDYECWWSRLMAVDYAEVLQLASLQRSRAVLYVDTAKPRIQYW